MPSTKELVEKYIEDNAVMIFAKSYCPHCKKAKEALSKVYPNFTSIDMDLLPNGADIQAILLEISGQRTVPNVYVKGKHIGGCDDTLKAISTGELQKMLA